MIRKLAEELAMNSTLSGSEADNPAPLESVPAPPTKPDNTLDPSYGFTEFSGERHDQTMHRFLDRALDNYDDAASQHEKVLTEVLGDHVKQISGSSATSQRAMKRFQDRSR